MKVKDIEQRIQEIAKVGDDYEVTHAMEDKLADDVLHAIADGSCHQPRKVAQALLDGLVSLGNDRWYA